MTIAVLGETVVDCVMKEGGTLVPALGGSPYNVARALALQGCEVRYLSPISLDAFGDMFIAELESSGVDTSLVARSERPSSLAVVNIDANGQPQYSLYREGVADRDYKKISSSNEFTLLHTGSLALVAEDAPAVHEIVLRAKEFGARISVDLNMRPGAVPDLDAYRASARKIIPLCDIVKASDEDLCVLAEGADPLDTAKSLFGEHSMALFVLTLGDKGAVAFSALGEQHCNAKSVASIVDTIGAGDCFQANLLAALDREQVLIEKDFGQTLANMQRDKLGYILECASAAAAFNVQHSGCHPPSLEELKASL